MLAEIPYDRVRAREYAHRWALSRNPLFYNYTGEGGDCTNFVSQCLYAGCCEMNYTAVTGWYYISSSDRTASWTGVSFLEQFLLNNRANGPYGVETVAGGLDIGDVIQLIRQDGDAYHSLIVTGFGEDTYLVSAHSDDALDRPLNTYRYAAARFFHIDGIRVDISDSESCFRSLIEGEAI